MVLSRPELRRSVAEKKHASNVFMWFGFPFGVGVMTESTSVKIKNCKEQKGIQKKVDNK
jgi:hypothetical protein